MVYYLIEFRFQGYAKRYAKNIIYEVARKFRVKGVTRKRAVPHISLFGPFTTKYERKAVNEVARIGRKYGTVPFKVKGFDYFRENKVIYLDIEPSKQLESLRWELSKSLLKICRTISSFDKDKKFYFHSTVAFKDISKKFGV